MDYFSVSIIHPTLTGTTGSLMSVFDLLHARGRGPPFIVSSTFVESARNLTPEKSRGA